MKKTRGRKSNEVEVKVNGSNEMKKLQSDETASQSAGLKDQRKLSLKDNLKLFVSR